MHPYEGVWGALLDEVLCGRPEGHNGQCRSRQAIARERERARGNWPKYREVRRLRRRQEQLAARQQLFDMVEAVTRKVTERKMANRTVNW